ncbi:MAG: hypothetical protein ACTSPF_08800 [Candidatus Heimdallarchaeaceae archaeon]
MFSKKKNLSEEEISKKPSEALKILRTNIENYHGYKELELRRDSDVELSEQNYLR